MFSFFFAVYNLQISPHLFVACITERVINCILFAFVDCLRRFFSSLSLRALSLNHQVVTRTEDHNRSVVMEDLRVDTLAEVRTEVTGLVIKFSILFCVHRPWRLLFGRWLLVRWWLLFRRIRWRSLIGRIRLPTSWSRSPNFRGSLR
jgi:hypothetical protein